MATQDQEKVDEFDAAFASCAAGEDKKPDGDAVVEGDKPDSDAGADGDGAADAAGDNAGDDAGGDAGADTAGDGDAAGDDGGDTSAGGGSGAGDSEEDPATDALIERLANLVKDAPAKPEGKQEQAPAAKAEEEQPIYAADEVEFLKKYEEDWADVAKGEALKRKAEYNELLKYAFTEVAKQLQPLLETVEVLSNRTHLTDLREKVNDYDTVRDKVVSWVEEQPTYLQTAYKQVIQQGTADEVADLISRYRQATGDAAKGTSQKPKVVELSDHAKKAAEELAPVDTKRSVIPQDEPSDFDSAFDRWAANQKH
jgi:hypothetical protein